MTKQPKPKRAKPKRAKPKRAKPTDAERHARFVETARAVGASEDPKEFEKAFGKVTAPPQPKNN